MEETEEGAAAAAAPQGEDGEPERVTAAEVCVCVRVCVCDVLRVHFSFCEFDAACTTVCVTS